MDEEDRIYVVWFITSVLAIALAIAAGIFIGSPRAQAQDCVFGSFGCGHHENHEQYKGWHRTPTEEQRSSGEKGIHCCKEGDCRPTRASKGNPDRPGEDDDTWYAWNGKRWLRVPPEAMLPADILKDGRNHICASEYDNVWCFSPTGPKG